MPARQRTIEPDVSLTTAQNIREARLAKGWDRPTLSAELELHRCKLHPRGCILHVQVIHRIENGLPRGKVRTVSVDELVAIAHVLELEACLLLGE